MSNWSANKKLDEIFQALQPFRDPIATFQIDVPRILKKFSEELNDITFAESELSEQQIRLNFYQAALLIQSSTLILSKKIDYLHVLAYEALNKVEDKKHKRRPEYSFGIDDYINQLPKDLFQEGYIEDYTPQNRDQVISNKTVSIPKLPPNLLSRESRQYIHVKFPDFKDCSGKDIGKWDDFMINNSLDTVNESLTTAKYLTERLYSDFEVECLRRAESEGSTSANNFVNDLTDAADGFGKRPIEYNNLDDVERQQESDTEFDNFNDQIEYVPSPSSETPLPEEEDISLQNTDQIEEINNKETTVLFTLLDPNSHIPSLDSPFKKHELKAKSVKKVSTERAPLNQLIQTLRSNVSMSKNRFKRPRCIELYPLMAAEHIRRLEKMAKIRDFSKPRSYDELTVGTIIQEDPIPIEFNSPGEEIQSFIDKKPYTQPDLHHSPVYGDDFDHNASPSENQDVLLSSRPSGIDITKYLLEVRRTGRKVETDLTRNVKNWEKHLVAKFAAQKKEPNFSISTYSSSITDWFSEEKSVPFLEKVKTKNSLDVSRLFVTMLHMVNSGNLELISEDKSQTSNNFSIRIMSRDTPSFEDI